VESVKGVEVVHATAHRLLGAISAPFDVRGEPVRVGASVGYTLREGTEDVTELLQRADIAMYAVKESGKHGVAAFTPDMFNRRSARAQLQQELAWAVRNGELRVHLQPVVFLSTGQIDGAEALVRWQHPTRGLLGPVDFIDVAEESGLIEEIGLWVLHQSWADAERLGARLGRPISLAVNVASGQLSGPSLVNAVAALPSGGCYPTLVLEVTERDLVDDPASTETLLELRALGVHIAVDDFGPATPRSPTCAHCPSTSSSSTVSSSWTRPTTLARSVSSGRSPRWRWRSAWSRSPKVWRHASRPTW
jgi:predicted signal transduction protein with EAL and GGDEF domain